ERAPGTSHAAFSADQASCSAALTMGSRASSTADPTHRVGPSPGTRRVPSCSWLAEMAADKSLLQMGLTPPHRYLAQVGFALMPSLQELIRTRIDRLSARYHDRAAIVVPPAGDTISIRPVIPGRGASIEITVDDDTQVEMDVGRGAHFELYEGRNREALADE